MANLRPLDDRVVLKVLDAEEMSSGGIVLPDTAKEKPQRGKVVAVGPGRYVDGTRQPLDVVVGDEVLYSKYGGTELNVDGEDLLVLNEHDILAKVAKAAAKGKK